MKPPASAQCNWRQEKNDELEFVVLSCAAPASAAGKLEAWIAPSQGSNLCRLSVDGMNVIDFEPELLQSDFTGTPVLYPTPNRVRDGIIHYEGKAYPQAKRGKTIFEHGLVHDEPWGYQEPRIHPDSICLTTWIDFEPASAIFEAFPFQHRLSLEFVLTYSGIQVVYTIENRDTRPIPFGFGFHPYFKKLSRDGGALVEIPAECIMQTTADLLPTGKLIEVAGTRFDVHKPTSVSQLDLDHIFTGVPDGQFAQVIYPSMDLSIRLVATSDFSHLVLYTPPGASTFCLENQTCSTDAHNLYDRGFRAESGLRFVPAGGVHTGSVIYQILRGAWNEN
jgi:aldose 1-epimerase